MNLNDPIILVGGAGFLVLLFIVVLSSLLGEGAKNRRKMRERMKTLGERGKKSKVETDPATSLRRDAGSTGLDKLARRILPNPDVLRNRLEATGKPITIGKYFGISILVGLIAAVAFWMFSGLTVLAAPFVGIAAGVLLPHKFVSRLIDKRRNLFVAQLAEGLDLIVRGVKSGLPVGETINSVGEEMDDPIAGEMKRVIEDTRIGSTLEEALWKSAQRVGVTEYKFFVVTLTVQRETGGNLAETLENLSDLVRTRKQMKLKIKAMSSEAVASRNILGGLPFGIAGVLSLIAPSYIGTLFVTDAGHWILGIGLALLASGWFVMNRMINFEI